MGQFRFQRYVKPGRRLAERCLIARVHKREKETQGAEQDLGWQLAKCSLG
jgi:hypothetical protein